jgi:hypothetical protein
MTTTNHISPSGGQSERPKDDAISRSKRILELIDIYVERPDRMNRNALRSHLFDEFTEAAGIAQTGEDAANGAIGEREAFEAFWLLDVPEEHRDFAKKLLDGYGKDYETAPAVAESWRAWKARGASNSDNVEQERDDTGRLTSGYEPTPHEIKVARDAICREFGNNGTDGYYIRILKAIHGSMPLIKVEQKSDIQETLCAIKNELAALITDPANPTVDQWPCTNPADRECLHKAYTAIRGMTAAKLASGVPTMLNKSSFKGELTDERLLFEKIVAEQHPDLPAHQIDFSWWLWQTARALVKANG